MSGYDATPRVSVGEQMAAVIFLLALVAAGAGFVIAYLAAGMGVLASLAIGYLTGSIIAILVVALSIFFKTGMNPKPMRFFRRRKSVSSPQPPRK